MRPEAEVTVRETAPYGDHLVGFAGVDIEQVLEQRIGGAGNVALGNGGEVVTHGSALSG